MVESNTFRLPRKLFFLLELKKIKKNEVFNIAEIERLFGFEKTQPDLRDLLTYLINQNILKLHSTIRSVNYYKLNVSKYKDFVSDCSFFEECEEFIHYRDLLVLT